MTVRREVAWAAVLGAMVLLALCACAAPTDQPALSTKPATPTIDKSTLVTERIQLRVRWSTASVIDLDSPTATFLRAIYESDAIAFMARDSSVAFPGYTEANRDLSRQYFGGRRARNEYWSTDKRTKIIRVDDLGNGTHIARICETGRGQRKAWRFPPLISNSNPPSLSARSPGMAIITFHKTGTPPPADQHGTASTPRTNVFGDWYMTGIQRAWHDNDPSRPNTRAECGDMDDLAAPGSSTPGWPTTGV